MSGQPGDGCDDPREAHLHWCVGCGAEMLFTRAHCQLLTVVPPCPRCGEKGWRDEVDELTAPDHPEEQRP